MTKVIVSFWYNQGFIWLWVLTP